MYTLIEPSGCLEKHGLVQMRLAMYLDPDDARYGDAGEIPQFHNHLLFIEPDTPNNKILDLAEFHLPNFYEAWRLGKKMRSGWSVEHRTIPPHYEQIERGRILDLRKSLCLQRVDEIKSLVIPRFLLSKGVTFPATNIDIGYGTGSCDSVAGQITEIDRNNTANATGILDTWQIRPYNNITNAKLGTFYGTSPDFQSRDYEAVGSILSGAVRTITGCTVDVETGDCATWYATGGGIQRNTSGGATAYLAGDWYGTGIQTFTPRAGHLALYGEGETPAVGTASKTALMGAKMIAGKMI